MNPYRALFWSLVYLGRPFGGIHPHRITYWLHRKAFRKKDLSESDQQWWRDRWGSELLLNPHYHLDSNIIAFGYYDKALHLCIDSIVRRGMICFDVGANIGSVATHLARRVGPDGRVHAFEPVPRIRERLRKNLERNNLQKTVIVHDMALSNRTGTASFAVAESDAENQGQGSLVNQDNPSLNVAVEVRTTTLDQLVRDNRIDQIDFMKIDIQGAEILLLEGGHETFARLAPDLLVEVSPKDLAGIGSNSKDLLALLESHGYRIHELAENDTPGKRITSDQIPPDYHAENVFCTSLTRSPNAEIM